MLSPADGRVLVAGPADPTAAPPGEWKQISIFLSPMDVHVNRSPVSGRVTKVDFRRGKFLPAYHRDAASTNERSEVWVDHDGLTVVFRQIVGILARRVVCRVQPGRRAEGGRAFRHHEIRLAHGRVLCRPIVPNVAYVSRCERDRRSRSESARSVIAIR